jgi:hypothetical protein
MAKVERDDGTTHFNKIAGGWAQALIPKAL